MPLLDRGDRFLPLTITPVDAYVQSEGFVLGRDGTVVVSVYSSSAIGRLLPEDVAGLVSHVMTTRPA